MLRINRALAATLTAFAASACIKAADGTFLFQSRATKQSVTAAARVVVHERWLAYLADELTTGAGGTDFNADGDKGDQIAVLVNMVGVSETRLDVAADDLAIIGKHLYLVTEEADDEVDWNGDGDDGAWDDLVLLHTPCENAGPATVAYVATLSRSGAGPRMLATDGDRLFFMEEPPALDPLVAPETSIAMIALVGGAPQAPVRLLNEDGANTLRPELMAQDSGIVFVTLNETLEGRNLNGDSDVVGDDAFVLALIDSTATTPEVKSVELALASATSPVRALDIGGDWVVAFLVDELAQGAGSLNDYDDFPNSWRPTHCTGSDTDSTDEVLHFLRFDAWFAGTPNNLFNTGFAGAQRVLATKNGSAAYVAALIPESEDGNCLVHGLNNDDDTLDHVLRWIKVESTLGSSGVFVSEDGLVAVADTPGGTHGVTDLAGRWLVVIDEAADGRTTWDGLAADHDVVAWLDPSAGNGATWTSDHSVNAGVQAAGASWMGEEAARTRTFVAFQEAVYGAPINARDLDLLDSIPTFVRFDPQSTSDLDFPGPAIAVDDDNAGLLIANGLGFLRVDEAADNFDWNDDGDKTDRVLFRTTISTMRDTFLLGTLSNLDRPAVESDTRNIGIAFLTDESMAGRDLNGDGDQNDYVVIWMRIGP